MDGGRLLRLLMAAAEHGVVKVVPTKVADHDRSHAAIVNAVGRARGSLI